MNSKAKLQTYKSVDRSSAAESDDPHAMITALLDELIRRMNSFTQNLDSDEEGLRIRNESFGRAIGILHALQSCLDFQQGGEVAENLFRLYEFARQQLLSSFKSSTPERTKLAIDSITEIRDAWNSMDASEQSPLQNTGPMK